MTKADVYSIGATLLSLLLGHYPFDTSVIKDYPDKLVKFARNGYNDGFYDEISIIIIRDTQYVKKIVCKFESPLSYLLGADIKLNPNLRLLMKQFLDHQWFRTNS